MPGTTAPVTGAAPGDGIGVCGMVQAPVSGLQAASVSAVRMMPVAEQWDLPDDYAREVRYAFYM